MPPRGRTVIFMLSINRYAASLRRIIKRYAHQKSQKACLYVKRAWLAKVFTL